MQAAPHQAHIAPSDPPTPGKHIEVLVGLPLTTGHLVDLARERDLPVLFSANAFARTYPDTHRRAGFFRDFRLAAARGLLGLDAALDSGGFVAAARYRDYRWTLDNYLDLVEARTWRWWASLDYCCEDEVAGDQLTRLIRIAATAVNFARCAAEARRRGLPEPMPVLQGYHPHEYLLSLRWTLGDSAPALVGVGSVCRRHLGGPAGLLPVLQALDQALPASTRLHLFGVKGSALDVLASHPRVVSIDSQAWDAQARALRRTGRTLAFRGECMLSWLDRQQQRVARHSGLVANQLPMDLEVPLAPAALPALVTRAVALAWCDLVLDGQVEYADALWRARQDQVVALAMAKQLGPGAELVDALDDLLAGAGQHLQVPEDLLAD